MCIKKSDSLVEYTKAMMKFRINLEQPKKDADNPFFKSKYVNLEGVQKAIKDALAGTGLDYNQWPMNDDNGKTGIATIVLHESGEYIEFPPYFMKSEKNTPQGEGSVLTYLRRYSLSTVFGVSSDIDDDGNVASGSFKKETQRQTYQNKAEQRPPTKSEAITKAKSLKRSIAELKDTTEEVVDGWLLKYMEAKEVSEIQDWNKAVVYLIALESKAKEQAGG